MLQQKSDNTIQDYDIVNDEYQEDNSFKDINQKDRRETLNN